MGGAGVIMDKYPIKACSREKSIKALKRLIYIKNNEKALWDSAIPDELKALCEESDWSFSLTSLYECVAEDGGETCHDLLHMLTYRYDLLFAVLDMSRLPKLRKMVFRFSHMFADCWPWIYAMYRDDLKEIVISINFTESRLDFTTQCVEDRCGPNAEDRSEEEIEFYNSFYDMGCLPTESEIKAISEEFNDLTGHTVISDELGVRIEIPCSLETALRFFEEYTCAK